MSNELRTAKDNLKRLSPTPTNVSPLDAYLSLRRVLTTDLLGPKPDIYGIETDILVQNQQDILNYLSSNGHEHSGSVDEFGYKFNIERPEKNNVPGKFINISGACWLKNPSFRLFFQIVIVGDIQTEAFWVRDPKSGEYCLEAVVAPDGEFLKPKNMRSTKRRNCVVINEPKILIQKKLNPGGKRGKPIFFEKEE